MADSLKKSIQIQRAALSSLIGGSMQALAMHCLPIITNREALEVLLVAAMPQLSFCKHLYILDALGTQITGNITRNEIDNSHFGRKRMSRPYMLGIVGITDFKLSEAYISRNQRRPSLTAVQVIRDSETDELVGFLGADFDLRELPHTESSYKEPDNWRQIKGDPAIRSGVFTQQRAESAMDQHIDDVISIMVELMVERGVFHGKFHFSSSRCTMWMSSDPFTYRLLNIDELTDPDICLAYPRRVFHERSIVKPEEIAPIFDIFRQLRFADENFYLRAGSLNVINGMVGLNFSCDGSHYMRYDEFLAKNVDFWFGTAVV